MRTKEIKEVSITQETETSISCDECGKEIRNSDNIRRRDYEHPYYEVSTHHHDWGNDSGESNRHFDLCSIDCLVLNMKEYFENANGSECYEVERYF
jgi:hypothetical protein